MKCEVCFTWLDRKRKTKQFCSTKCRMKAFRKRDSVTHNPLSVTDSVTISSTRGTVSVTEYEIVKETPELL